MSAPKAKLLEKTGDALLDCDEELSDDEAADDDGATDDGTTEDEPLTSGKLPPPEPPHAPSANMLVQARALLKMPVMIKTPM